MRRSEINAAQRQATALIEELRFVLPPWAMWSPQEWAAQPQVAAYCRERQMGWDVTDFGNGDFPRQGLLLFGMRNGRLGMPGEITYAEKLLMIGEGQVTPLHTHNFKTEDIINRGGGVLVLELASATTGGISDAPVTVLSDGRELTLPALESLHLHPGQSVTLHPGTYHRFYALPGHGPVMAGEVSAVNDDQTDNLFLEPAGRFPTVQEDEATLYPLWSELPAPA
ncbi:D-lyxose/D-mannose family sugar isomerase [Deinococcus sp.]|uniref:D-lyxose/D-mannose family sugar isomerase n=1 Tax=Deinococcus sp. TaxID=47478 RepID=UPI002869BF0A|nr:D-lyxose/D-mannose family sugar isomerase [Deinococcus sp.]